MNPVLEIAARAEETVFRRLDSFPFTAGRGYGNDLILPDPHADERQFRIDGGEDGGWLLRDLSRANPTLLNGRPCGPSPSPLFSGDVLQAGGLRLRFLAADHPVAPALLLQEDGNFFFWLARPVNAWASFALGTVSSSCWIYVDTWSEDPGVAVSAAAAAAASFVFVWAALWTVAGRLLRHKSAFTAHVGCAGLALAVNAGVSAVLAAADFLLHENGAAVFLRYALNGAVLAGFLYASLTLSAQMRRRRRVLAAAFFAGGLALGMFAMESAAARKFSPDPPYPSRLEPFLSALAPAIAPAAFMAENGELLTSLPAEP